MNDSEKKDMDTKIALFRYEMIIPVLNRTYPDRSAIQYYKRVTSVPLQCPDGARDYSYQTVRYWYDKYKKEGFDGLYPKTRADKGHSRKLSKSVKDKIIRLKTEIPRMTATSIYLKLIEDGDIFKNDISLSTVTRFLSSRPELGHKPVEDMRAFEMQYANDMWQMDTTYCSYIVDQNGRKQRTFLIMIIDDRSRMIVGYGFFLEDTAVNVQTVFKKAILKYGLPKKIYVDNGTPYKNEQLSLICAQLQVQLSHAQPYHGNQKGKIERAFKSVKEQWMYNTDFSAFRTLDDINESVGEYINKKNNTPHSSLDGETPVNVFMNDSDRIRRAEAETVEKAFYHTVTRNVNSDATVKLLTRVFEAGQNYIGLKVTLKYKPDLSHVFIFEDGNYIEIHEVNKNDNAKIRRNQPLFTQEEE